MIHNFKEVTKGVFRGSAPSPKDVVWLKEKLGINKIISLDEEAGERIDRVCKLLGINHIKIYIESRQDLQKLLQHNLKKLLLTGGPTFFHCQLGKDRTGLLAALFKCKYMGMSSEDAIKEAKSFGFGIGIDPKMTALYEKLIRVCKPAQDENHADIVSNERDYKADNRDSYLDESRPSTFAPYLDHSRHPPMDIVYNSEYEQSPTRENYHTYKNPKKLEEDDIIPQVGVYNNDATIQGMGPSAWTGGFITD